MEPTETAKKHKIPALAMLMISRGTLWRDHISTHSQIALIQAAL
jgi:hypothetical protein